MEDLKALEAAYKKAADKLIKIGTQLAENDYDDLFATERKYNRAHAAMQKAKVAFLNAGGHLPLAQ